MARRSGTKPRTGAFPTMAQLASFAALVRWGKQAAAEAALGRSQSQISRDLSSLEKALGAPLMDRDERRPTAAGKVLLAYAEEVLEGWTVTKDRLGGESEVTGSVTLAAPGEVHEAVLVPLLTRLRARWDRLRVLTAVAAPRELAGMLRAGAADIGVLPSGDHAGLNTRPLLSARLYAAVPGDSAWASRKSVPANPGSGTCLLLNSQQTSALCEPHRRAFAERWGRKPAEVRLGGGRGLLLDAVAAGLGVAWLFVFEEGGDPLARTLPPGVVLRPVSGMPVRFPFCVAVREGRPAGGAVEFVLREILRHFRRT